MVSEVGAYNYSVATVYITRNILIQRLTNVNLVVVYFETEFFRGENNLGRFSVNNTWDAAETRKEEEEEEYCHSTGRFLLLSYLQCVQQRQDEIRNYASPYPIDSSEACSRRRDDYGRV